MVAITGQCYLIDLFAGPGGELFCQLYCGFCNNGDRLANPLHVLVMRHLMVVSELLQTSDLHWPSKDQLHAVHSAKILQSCQTGD